MEKNKRKPFEELRKFEIIGMIVINIILIFTSLISIISWFELISLLKLTILLMCIYIVFSRFRFLFIGKRNDKKKRLIWIIAIFIILFIITHSIPRVLSENNVTNIIIPKIENMPGDLNVRLFDELEDSQYSQERALINVYSVKNSFPNYGEKSLVLKLRFFLTKWGVGKKHLLLNYGSQSNYYIRDFSKNKVTKKIELRLRLPKIIEFSENVDLLKVTNLGIAYAYAGNVNKAQSCFEDGYEIYKKNTKLQKSLNDYLSLTAQYLVYADAKNKNLIDAYKTEWYIHNLNLDCSDKVHKIVKKNLDNLEKKLDHNLVKEIQSGTSFLREKEIIKNLNNQIIGLKNDLKEADIKLERLKTEKELLKELNLEQSKKYKNLIKENENLKKQRDEYKLSIESLKSTITELNQLISGWESNSVSKEDYYQLKGQFDKLVNENEIIKKEVNVLKNVYAVKLVGIRESNSKIKVGFTINGIEHLNGSNYIENDQLTLRLQVYDIKKKKYIESIEENQHIKRIYSEGKFNIKGKQTLDGIMSFTNTSNEAPFKRLNDFRLELYVKDQIRPLIVTGQDLRNNSRIAE